MNDDQKRLLNLLHDNRISRKEFKLLYASLNANDGILIKTGKFLLNPFQLISGITAFILGMVLLAILAMLAWHVQLHFIGLLDFDIIKHGKHMWLSSIYLELIASWGLISLLFLLSAFIFRVKSYQIIDIFAFTALAKFPYLCKTIILLIIKPVNPKFFMATADKFSLYSFGDLITIIWMSIFYTIYTDTLTDLFSEYFYT
jgi:hypothetical protein